MVIKLRNALDVLDYRVIAFIGGRVFHYIIPEKYDKDIGFEPKCYLIQVWRKFSDI